jgi:hypothetical protein
MSLRETGISINSYSLSVSPPNVAIKTPHFRVKLPMSVFKRFAEWYLEDQGMKEES